MSRDILDDALAVGCMFDWITPLMAIVTTLFRGGTTLSVSLDTGLGRNEVKDILRRQGIDCWGLQYAGDHILYTVHRKHEFHAERVLSGFAPYRSADGGGMSMLSLMLILGALLGLAGYLWWVGAL